MQRPLHVHISYLEQKIDTLQRRLLDPDLTEYVAGELRADLAIAQRALASFRKAFELEQRISH
jgi:hypothetical protein